MGSLESGIAQATRSEMREIVGRGSLVTLHFRFCPVSSNRTGSFRLVTTCKRLIGYATLTKPRKRFWICHRQLDFACLSSGNAGFVLPLDCCR
jgi:hypothetical protein